MKIPNATQAVDDVDFTVYLYSRLPPILFIGGVSLNSLTNSQLEETIRVCQDILYERSRISSNIKAGPVTELLKPGLKKEIQSTFQQDP